MRSDRNNRSYSNHVYAKQKPQKRRRKRRNRGLGRFIFLVVLIAIVVVGGFTAFKFFTSNTYDDSKSFEKYASKYFSKIQEKDQIGKSKENYLYGKPVSIGQNYPEMDLKVVDKQVKKILDDEKTTYQGKHASDDPNEKYAQLTGYDSYKSDKKTGSIVLKTTTLHEKEEGTFSQDSATVKTINFNIENGSAIYPIMAFESGYQDKLSKFFEGYLKDKYSSDLTDNYSKYINKDNKFDNFALTSKGAIFYFDSNTVVKSDEIIAIDVSSSDVEGVFREKINPRSLDPSKPMVALTFDDGPAEGVTGKILDDLEENNAVATFFELGQNVENVKSSKAYLERMVKMGCEVGSHSWSHPNLFTLSTKQIQEQNDMTDKAIEKRIGQKPTVYRPPYGNGDAKTTKIFNKPGILWSVDTLDWKSRNADAVNKSIKAAGNLDGKVILMHSLYDSTEKAMEKMIPELLSEGYQLVTVSELLTYKYHEDPQAVKFYGYNYFYLDEK